MNKELSIEPRIGITKEVRDGIFSIALGKHSQVEHFATYMYQDENEFKPNKNLDFAKAIMPLLDSSLQYLKIIILTLKPTTNNYMMFQEK